MGMALVKNPLFARYFDRCGARNEERGNRELRRELLAGLSGRVLEVGAGNGLNFPHYPASVREVVAVEPEPYLRGRAMAAASAAPVPVRVADGTAAELPAADAEFDAVVISGGHVQRQTREAIGRAFAIEACRGFRFPPSAAFSPVAPRILGVARKADSSGQ